MGTIDEIIKALDFKLLKSGKPYLTLGQANKELVDKRLMSVSERSNNELKKLLEKGLIPNSSQTQNKPKQWRFFLSEEGKNRKIKYENIGTQKSIKKNNNIKTSSKKWFFGIAIFIFIFLLNYIDKSDNSVGSSNTEYIINTTSYVATSKSKFDEMFRYINDNDEQALSTLMAYGDVQILPSGTNVYLVSSHFSYCIVRKKGSIDNLYVVTEYLTRK